MINREKVIKGLECAIGIRGIKNCDDCPYDNDFNCLGCDIVIHDAIALLKEQEQKYVNSIAQQISCFSGTCPKCGKMLNTTCNKNFCGDCGQAVKWNDNDRY